MNRKTRNEALSNLSLEVFRVTSRLNNLADRLSREVGLSSARWQVLSAIEAAESPLSVAEIARRMGLQRQSVQRTTDALETENFIAYEANPRHRRAKLTNLTPKGIRALHDMRTLREQWADSLKQDLRLQDLEQATDVLVQLRDLLDKSPY